MRRRTIALAAALGLLATACAVAFDFDGDGKADIAWSDANGGTWTRLNPDTSTTVFATLPSTGDTVPAAADYDGNGTTEVANVDLITGVWTTAGSRGTFTFAPPTAASVNDLVPVPADYDGDGADEPGWYRLTDASWWIEGFGYAQWGIGSDTATSFWDAPLPADWDGDGDDDIAVYSLRNRAVDILGQASREHVPVGFVGAADLGGSKAAEWIVADLDGIHVEGQATPVAVPPSGWPNLVVPADYDGDGRQELAVASAYDSNEWWVEDRGVVTTLPSGAFPATARPWQNSSILAHTFALEEYLGCPGGRYLFGLGSSWSCFPTPADLDGDRRTDTAWIGQSGDWYTPGGASLWSPPAAGLPLTFLEGWWFDSSYPPDPFWVFPRPALVDGSGTWYAQSLPSVSYPPPGAEPAGEPTWIPFTALWAGPGVHLWYSEADGTFWREGVGLVADLGVGADELPPGSRDWDVPLVGSFGNDPSIDDLAVYSPRDGTVTIRLDDGSTQVRTGIPLGYPAVADIDRDGIDEIVIMRGPWHKVWIEGHGEHDVTLTTGEPTWLVPGDYDGDAAEEPAVAALTPTELWIDGQPTAPAPAVGEPLTYPAAIQPYQILTHQRLADLQTTAWCTETGSC